ncbi:hypothetical protein ACUY3K_02935 [Corynebacterium uberis]|uniref:hypothetical protein n=1 Tax=Corynebacterium TaxID=1716 RepID=UPI001D0A8FA2|nr:MULTISPECIES: hypothetical protein [Corynebacterium]MCZ9309669.1 hypothetical protein [Corynebacterium sp. c6VSa_13]UDL73473.1 hypothetical protein LH391_10410 [Corynebacterium uberis]UDL77860.1 hypothetical protein LH394_10500 [Corynebacterium uberis]UDL80143.1 hypothetical protein LH392_10920 [Corynebacterium uberis]UDL82276.1 hypothetical protein LH395_10505 [Corynebacterium uberis]
MPAASLNDVARLIRMYPDTFRDATHSRFYVDHLEARNVFPLRLSDSHLDLAPAVAWVLENSTPGQLGEVALDFVRSLGMDHRRHGFPAVAYATFAHNLRFGLREVLRTAGEPYTLAAQEAEELIEGACVEMAAVAVEADQAGIPPAYTGEVISVTRVARRISTVTLDTGLGVPFRPGQYLRTTTAMLPGLWIPMAPASPPNDFGQIDFHVFAEEGSAAQRLSMTQVGDHWTFSQPHGAFGVDGSRDILMIAHSTGWAPLRSIMFDLMNSGQPPRVTLFLAADYPGELYELASLIALARASYWLTVIPCATHRVDDWWVSPLAPTPDVYIAQADNAGELAMTRGYWPNDDVLIAGPAADVNRSAAALEAAGCRRIQTQPW